MKTDGIIFIGDPHITSRKPGRRKDDFESAILGKLQEAINVANLNNCQPIILGDLFDRPKESSEALKTKTMRILNSSNYKPICLVGNHDISNEKLSDGDTLAMFSEAGVLEVIKESGIHCTLEIGGKTILLGGTPYGQEIPDTVMEYKRNDEKVIWLTHHDLAFGSTYPGAQELFEIDGCGFVINGHMHHQKDIEKRGKTVWFNPGNITRKAIDDIDHVPSIWKLNNDFRIEQIVLTYEKDVISLKGRLVDEIQPSENASDIESAFANLLSSSVTGNQDKTADGAYIWDQIKDKFENDQTDSATRAYITDLFNTSIQS